MKILIETIPHEKQRYNVVGDYFKVGDTWHIPISDMGNDDYHFALVIHELWEWYLAQKAGVKNEDIDAYEMKYHKDFPDLDPDLEKDSPVYGPAQFALGFERLTMAILGIDQKEYDKKLEEIYEAKK